MSRKRISNRDLPQRVYLKHGSYFFVTAEKKWIKLGKSKSEMYKSLAELEIRPMGSYTITSLWNDYREDELHKLSIATKDGYIKCSLNILKAFGHMAPDEIKSPDVARYLLVRGKKAKNCANKEVAVLSTMYTYAVSLGIAERNPCLRVKRHKLSPRTRYIEDWELAEFRSVCDDMLDCYVELKFLTGLRKTDMLKLTLAQVKESGLYIRPSKTKNSTGETREFEWTPDLRRAIEAAKALPRPQYETHIFCNKRGKPFIDDHFKTPAFDLIWNKAMKQALQETQLRERFQEKDIRAKTATDADDNDQNATKILGHESSNTTKIYLRSKQVKRIKPFIRSKNNVDDEDSAEA
jgi:site-specific recombinase XerD